MSSALIVALLFIGSRDSWLSFALGAAAGLAVILIANRLRRKEDR